jgi:hypothetical protein
VATGLREVVIDVVEHQPLDSVVSAGVPFLAIKVKAGGWYPQTVIE